MHNSTIKTYWLSTFYTKFFWRYLIVLKTICQTSVNLIIKNSIAKMIDKPSRLILQPEVPITFTRFCEPAAFHWRRGADAGWNDRYSIGILRNFHILHLFALPFEKILGIILHSTRVEPNKLTWLETWFFKPNFTWLTHVPWTLEDLSEDLLYARLNWVLCDSFTSVRG